MQSPKVTVVIPIKNGEATIGECVGRLRASGYANLEIIVIDDHSDDQSAAAAEEAGAKVVRCEKDGVSAARNFGAQSASGDYLIFTDADVFFEAASVAALLEGFRSPEVDAAVGLFTKMPASGNFASVYKNAWMRFTYQRMPDRIALFFTSVAAIKKDVFDKSGGFDENYKAPSVEDTDLGRRLAGAGVNIQMRRDAEVVHGKKYTVAGLLATDFRRASALTKLFLREKARGANDKREGGGVEKRFSAPVSYALGAFAMSAALVFSIMSAVSFAATGRYCVHSVMLSGALSLFAICSAGSFFRYIARTHGAVFLIYSFIYWVFDCPAAAAGAISGAAGFFAGKRY